MPAGPDATELSAKSASRAHPPPPRRLSLLLGAIVVVGVGGALVFKLASPRPAHVPLGIADFTLGSTLAAARQTAPGLVERRPGKYSAPARVFDVPGECELGMGRADTVTAIDCTLSPTGELEVQRRRLLATLRSLYGSESRTTRAQGVERWVWENARAELVLEQGDPTKGAALRLVNRLASDPD